jgi:prenylcysteine alpha-carboxyl methylesterase
MALSIILNVVFSMLLSNRVYLMGQSAGGHIAACALVEQAIKEAGEGGSTTWSVLQIKTYFGLSGG